MVCHHTRPSSCSIFPYHHMIWARGPFVVMRCRAISHPRARACARPNSVMPPSARSPSIRPPRERALTEELPRHTRRDASRHHPEGVLLCAVCGAWRARAGPAAGRGRRRRPPTHLGRPDLGVCCVLCVGRSVGRSVGRGGRDQDPVARRGGRAPEVALADGALAPRRRGERYAM